MAVIFFQEFWHAFLAEKNTMPHAATSPMYQLYPIQFRMNPKGYVNKKYFSTRTKSSRSARRPHLLGVTLWTNRLGRTRDLASHPVPYYAYFLGIRSPRSKPPLVVGTWNLPNMSIVVIG